jgi:hypothetical protein
MEMVWTALGISAIVVFVFYVLAQHWQRMLRQQSWTLRRLADRVRDLEEMADPEFRQRLSESAPVPLEQVFTLSFRLDDRFWREALRTTEEDRKFIREFGSFVGSVKLERWRSHTVATITEVLPDRKATGWQTRSLDFYPDPTGGDNTLTLWELDLARPGPSAERPPSLELILLRDAMELRGHLAFAAEASGNGKKAAPAWSDVVFFRVPLDIARLAEFRSNDPLESANNGNERSGTGEIATSASSWQMFYSDHNESLGIEWQLRLRDLGRKSDWDRWKILESGGGPVTIDEA